MDENTKRYWLMIEPDTRIVRGKAFWTVGPKADGLMTIKVPGFLYQDFDNGRELGIEHLNSEEKYEHACALLTAASRELKARQRG